MGALYKLQAKVFFRNPSSFFTFIVISIYTVILGSVVVYNESYSEFAKSQALILVFASISSIAILNISLYSFGFSFFDMKNSVLLKRIGSTKISKTQIIATFALWSLTLLVMLNCYMLFLFYFFSNLVGYFPTFNWSLVNWSGYFLAILIGCLASFSIGFFLISISKNSEIYNVYSVLYFFTVSILGGIFTPGANEAWMDWIGRFSPIYWTANLISHSAAGGSVFHLGGYDINVAGFSEPVETVSTTTATLEWVMPIVFTGVFVGITTKTFKWS